MLGDQQGALPASPLLPVPGTPHAVQPSPTRPFLRTLIELVTVAAPAGSGRCPAVRRHHGDMAPPHHKPAIRHQARGRVDECEDRKGTSEEGVQETNRSKCIPKLKRRLYKIIMARSTR